VASLLTLADYEARAREVMPEVYWELIYHGSGDEVSTRRIRPAFDSILLKPQALRDVSEIDTSTTVLGEKVSFPVGAACPGHKHYSQPDGEIAAARATRSAGALYITPHVASFTSDPVEVVAAETSGGPLWFQLYLLTDQGVRREAVERAEATGCSALVVTVSAPIVDWHAKLARDRDVRNKMHLFDEQFHPEMNRRRARGFKFDKSSTWATIESLASSTSLPIVVKGLVSPQDARLAEQSGARGIVVSTHAARLMDGPITTIEALPYMVDAVDSCEVYLDGGIRRGADVLKAIALGAKACLIGKPLLYALGVDGERGIAHTFEILRHELETAMRLCGVKSLDEVGRGLLARPELARFASQHERAT
jgi:4-hydroxymandelate oxidase